MTILGIDLGIQGAVAVLDKSGRLQGDQKTFSWFWNWASKL